MKGIFTISLDFELHWGGFEKWRLGDAASASKHQGPDYRQYFWNTRALIPELLRLFEFYEVHVTWATVGMLFHKSKMELLNNAPAQKPSYENKALSAYHYIDTTGIGVDEGEDPFHYASSLIQQILKTPHQELGTHTFAHYYCNEPGQTIDEFRADIRAAQHAARIYGTTLRSLVFPRNQFNDRYLEVCWQEGITSVRSNPLDWFWHIESTQRESLWKRLNRGLDAYFPIGKKNTFRLDSLHVRHGYPVSIPASRLLRPYSPREFFLNDFKIARIENEMTRAADKGEVYHLWWHPHNFGSFPQQSLQGLERILKRYASLRDSGRMQSCHMQDLTSMLNTQKTSSR
jgi:peptidoglycan/xylan/chitin deacetylase (PgdA/CDA1 family)